jgi:hypothetical protein
MGCVRTLVSLNMIRSGLVVDLELFLVVSYDFKFGLVSLSCRLFRYLFSVKPSVVAKINAFRNLKLTL